MYCFNFQSNQGTFLSVYKNIVKLLAWQIKFEKREALKIKISEKLMRVVWYFKRWQNCEKIRKKKKNKFLMSNAFNVYYLRL